MKNAFAQKFTRDLMVSFLITYFFLLVPEIILPGVVSSHVSPKYFLLVLIFIGLIFSVINRKQKAAENPKFQAVSSSLLNIIFFVISVMLILSIYKMKFWQIGVVAAGSMLLLFLASHILIINNEKE